MTMTAVIAQAAAEAPSFFYTFGWLAIVMVIFYVLLIHPQRRRQKEHEKMLEGLASGDKVVTSGGVVGTITKSENGRIRLKVAPSVELTVLRSHVAGKLGEEAS